MNGNTNLLLKLSTVSKYDYVFTKTVTIKEKYLCVFSDEKSYPTLQNFKILFVKWKIVLSTHKHAISQWNWSEHLN